MTPTQYVSHLRRLGLTTAAAAPVLGISRRPSFKYASGEQAIPEPVAKLLRALVSVHELQKENEILRNDLGFALDGFVKKGKALVEKER